MHRLRLVTGIITLIGFVCLIGILIFLSTQETTVGGKLALALTFIFSISALFFTAVSLFRDSLWSKASKLELQNKILKKQIEQQRLKKELDESVAESEIQSDER